MEIQLNSRRKRLDNTIALFGKLARCLAPPPKVTLSEWADKYRQLSRESAAQPGQWKTENFQRDILDAISDPSVERVVVMAAAQVIKTEALLNGIGYFMDYDPAPIMLVQPTIQMAESFSKQRLAPMIRDSPKLRGLIADPKTRQSNNTILEKSFIGGYIVVSGANSPSSLASRPIRILFFDEVDRANDSAGTEGDPVALAEKRTLTFWNRKIVLTSTPTIKNNSKIEESYINSSQGRWNVACPSCGEFQPYEWQRLDFETACMLCSKCEAAHTRIEWQKSEGKWIHDNPHSYVKGFHLNAMAAPWNPVKWEYLIDEWRLANRLAEKGNAEKLKVFVNTMLGETWEERGEKVDDSVLMQRREPYFADIPDGVLALTMGVDTQDSRLCYEIVGWSLDVETWGIEYGELWGDPRQGRSDVWTQLDDVINKNRYYANNKPLKISCVTVDMGGHAPDEVCTFTKARRLRHVYAIRGKSGNNPLIGSSGEHKKTRTKFFNIHVDTGKDDILSRLRVPTRGGGYCHFPKGENDETIRGYDEQYFAGLTCEKKIPIKNKSGFTQYRWVKPASARNEPFDCRNYAGAALKIRNQNLDRLFENALWLEDSGSTSSKIIMKNNSLSKRRNVANRNTVNNELFEV